MTLFSSCECQPKLSVVVSDAERAQSARRDPTGTSALRRSLRSELVHRFRTVRRMTRAAIEEQDLLGLQPVNIGGIILSLRMGTPGLDRVLMFQNWFDEALRQTVLGNDGQWLRPYINAAYRKGQSRAEGIIQSSGDAWPDSLMALSRLAVAELQGIEEALSQRAVRAVTMAIVSGSSARAAGIAIAHEVETVAVPRARSMANTQIVQAHATATLDMFETAGIERVGILPEWMPSISFKDARRAGSRTRRRGRTGQRSRPSAAEIEAAERGAAAVERFREVEVLTAGDDDVCLRCEEIADDGPYPINQARRLIPAHPNCRCAFVPFFDRRFAEPERMR